MLYTIAIPKGRLGLDAESVLSKSGFIEMPISRDSRKLIFRVSGNMKAILLRAWDVPSYVETGTADLGICGKDDIMEHDADVLEILNLSFGSCTMAVAAKSGVTKEDLFSRPYLRVATKYPNIARRYFSSISVQAEIIKLYGSVELAAVTGMCDCIVDIVSTGGTLKDNGLLVIEPMFKSSARVIVNRASFYRHLGFMNNFIERIKSVL